MITKAGQGSDKINIVFYREDSIKNREKNWGVKSKEMVVISPNHVILENFWSSSTSKSAFQTFYVECITTSSILVYHCKHGWCQTGCASVFSQLNCTHEKTDDWMMFQILSRWSRLTSVTLLSTPKQPNCKKRCGPCKKKQHEKSCEIKGGGPEVAVVVW